ncbi:MAG: hypothetical protein IAF38_22490 [Bacteroidia bacterium]|nr:hypothetical protein [Bacteroidia bacterium]
MKKNILLFLIFMGCYAVIFAGEKTTDGDTIKSRYTLDSARKAEYGKFEDTFTSWFHKKYCVKMKIKISCNGCSRFYFPVTFKIDEKGKIVITETNPGLFCGKELTEKQKTEFVKGFQSIVFSKLFYGRVVFFNFNRALSC